MVLRVLVLKMLLYSGMEPGPLLKASEEDVALLCTEVSW